MNRFAILIFLFVCHSLFAQWEWQNVTPQGNHLNTVFFVTEEKGWAVGELGTVVKTEDGGDNWSVSYVDSNVTLNDVYFMSETEGIAVGDRGLVFRTEDGGVSWTASVLHSILPHFDVFNAVWFTSDNIGWIAGEYNLLFKTEDGGHTWNSVEKPFNNGYDIHFLSENYGWIVGTAGDGNVLRTTDSGNTWEAKHLDNRVYVGVQALDEQTACIALNMNEFMRTTDGGDTWAMQYLTYRGQQVSIKSIDFVDHQTGWIVSEYFNKDSNHHMNVVFNSQDGGVTWDVIGDELNVSIRSLFFVSETTGWMVGRNGVLFRTLDGGMTWVEQSSRIAPDYEGFYDIDFVTSETGWISGYNGLLLQTRNGGADWQVIKFDDTHEIMQMDFVSETQGWLTGRDGYIYSTDDGGQTLIHQFQDENVFFRDILMIDNQLGWACGYSKLLKTEDGGHHWVEQFVDSSHIGFQKIFFLDDQNGWLIGEFNILFKTNDGGQNWTKIVVPEVADKLGCEFSFYDIYFINELLGWIAGGEGTIMKSDDGGLTWELQNNDQNNTETLFGLEFISETEGWAVGHNGLILKTEDGGLSWVEELSHSNSRFIDVKINNGEMWLMGQEGTLLNKRLSSATGIVAHSQDLQAASYILKQNYPNPFNPSTRIPIHLTQSQHVRIDVFDVRGRSVATLADDLYSTGVHIFEFSGLELASGTYIYQVQMGERIENVK